MCGIVGIFSSDFREVTPELLGRMTETIRHRGPDDEGYVLSILLPADAKQGQVTTPLRS